MPMFSDVKNCLFGDGTLPCDILLAGLFLISVAFLFRFAGFAMIALFVDVFC